MRYRRILLAGLLLSYAAAAQTAETPEAKLSITGDIPAPLVLSAADLARMPRDTVTVEEQDGEKTTYEGVPLQEVLKKAGVSFGREMRGKALAGYVVAKAEDGYEVTFSFGELDPGLGAAHAIIADKRGGKALFGYQGPLRLVVATDKAPARGVRLLEQIEVVRLVKPYAWILPKGFPAPRVPADNPMTTEKVRLGQFLFNDKRMSVNGTYSCASCHRPELAFTDGRARAVGATGEMHPRNAMSLVNVAYNSVLTWNNPRARSLEDQALIPMFGEHPVELGLRGEGAEYLGTLRAASASRALFASAFPEETNPITIKNVTRAIACFERTLIYADSPYDRYHYGGDDDAVSQSAKRGEVLFFSEPLSCFRCHGGFNFSDATDFVRASGREIELDGPFHNTGLYNPFEAPNLGIYEFTHQPRDIGKFKAPTLRNIALTAPYMHDGSVPTLDAVLDHYSAGGRAHDNPDKDSLIRGFRLSAQDRLDLIAFLESLTSTRLPE